MIPGTKLQTNGVTACRPRAASTSPHAFPSPVSDPLLFPDHYTATSRNLLPPRRPNWWPHRNSVYIDSSQRYSPSFIEAYVHPILERESNVGIDSLLYRALFQPEALPSLLSLYRIPIIPKDILGFSVSVLDLSSRVCFALHPPISRR